MPPLNLATRSNAKTDLGLSYPNRVYKFFGCLCALYKHTEKFPEGLYTFCGEMPLSFGLCVPHIKSFSQSHMEKCLVLRLCESGEMLSSSGLCVHTLFSKSEAVNPLFCSMYWAETGKRSGFAILRVLGKPRQFSLTGNLDLN
jgi:hypothetical protein